MRALQGVAITVLSNCVLSKPVRDAAARLVQSRAATLASLRAVLQQQASSQGSSDDACALCSKVLDLLTNMATDAATRQLLAADHLPLVRDIAELATASGGAQAAALGCLCNLALEPGVQRALVSSSALRQLLGLACAVTPAAGGGSVQVATHAAVAASRAAKQDVGAAALQQAGALQLLVPALSGAVGHPALHAWQDAAVRLVALVTAAAAAGQLGSCGEAGASSAAQALLAVLPQPGLPDSVLGNACLSLGHIASQPDWLPMLHGLDAVAPLLRVAHAGRGNVASKNAAIALAKLAKHPPMLQRLRDLHGLEIIYTYVRP